MGDFNRGNKFRDGDKGGRGGFNRGGSGGGFGGREDREKPTMHPATCDNCHQQCEVPFKPNGSKPVYCKNCFSTMREESGDERPQRNDRPQRDFKPAYQSTPRAPQADGSMIEMKKQIEALNSKVDRILSLMQPIKPTAEEKPIETMKMDDGEKAISAKPAKVKIDKKPKAKKK